MSAEDALLAAEQEAAEYEDPDVPLINPHSHDEDPEVPFISPHSYCHNSLSSSEAVRCAICSNRQKRSRVAFALFLVWSVPLALAAGRCYGWWGPSHPGTTNAQPDGHLLMVQVLFRHGARTPLSNLYWPNSTWTHCKHNPLAAAAAGSTRKAGITLQLYDPSGAPNPPELSGDGEPVLPGGCRMGHLTDAGFQNALDLGAQLRQRYVDQHKLLPPRQLDTRLVHAESTAVQRTVATLRGVLSGLYPNASGVVRVAVRPYSQEVMTTDWDGCPVLANLTSQLTDLQQARDADDPTIQELQHQVRSGLQLPADAAILWNRLRDELACMEAEGQSPPAAAMQQHLVKRVDYVTTQHRVEVAAPEAGNCLLGRAQEQQCQEVTALTTGRLLHTFVTNMATAAVHDNRTRAAEDPKDDGSDGGSGSPAGSKVATARRLLASTAAGAAGGGSHEGVGDEPEPEQQPQPPKLMLFAAHDTTLLPLLSALGQHQTSWPGFASNLALELWGHKGKYFVRVLHDGEPVRLPLSAAQPQGEGSSNKPLASQLHSGLGQTAGSWATAGQQSVLTGIVRMFETLKGFLGRLVSVVDTWLDELAALMASVVGHKGTAVSAGRLRSNGEGVYNTAAYVVTLDEFQQRVVQDYVMEPEQYAAACGGGDAGGGGGVQALDDAQARRRWHAQFY